MSTVTTRQVPDASVSGESSAGAGDVVVTDRGSGTDRAAGEHRTRIGFWLGIALFLAALLLPTPEGLPVEGQRVGAVALLMATWWMSEALPLPATALLPIVLFPMLGVMSTPAATTPYGNHLIFLYMGGFMIALAMQRWGLHRRIALAVVAVVGTEPRRLVLGFMLATGFLSAWLSNTATVVMMLPIGMAILGLLEEDESGPLGAALMLGLAYAASIGGVSTLIGTPPNAVFAAAAGELLGRSIGFVEWMYVGVPFSTVLLFVTWFFLVRIQFPLAAGSDAGDAAAAYIREQRAGLGRMGVAERVVAVVFALTALAWVLREPKQLAGASIPGISTYLPMVNDSTIAIAAALVLFALPASLEKRSFVLDWEWAVRIPWGVLLLFGGGLSLALGFEQSGLAAWIGDQVTHLAGLPLVALVAVVVTLFIFLTELTSNTATATMGMPIMAGVAAGVGADPLILMTAAAIASSMAFMLPVATPPNAIVFGTGRITIAKMVRAGIWLNLISIALVTLTVMLVVRAVLGG